MAQQLNAGIGALAFERISRIALDAVVTVFPLFRIAAPSHFGWSRHRRIPAAIASRRWRPRQASMSCDCLVAGLFRARNTGAKNRPYNCHRTSLIRAFFT
ncbi:hypothetical protein [Burkholderia sp. Bp9143]|uniref:hypothetical protein n=1 Tax=Burkholderia sp. Bp9143 TaxID=2184574 RepID=UPI0021AB4FD8|nr:hypothetical protein [Burkholderia sp. Bp9143]